MGLSTTISTAFFALILVTGSAYIISLNIDMMKTTTEPLETYVDTALYQLNEKCVIDSWNNQTLHTLDINITNTGDEGIRVARLGDLDVIISYTSSGESYTDWISYDQERPSSNHWSIVSVYTDGIQGDTINVINISGETYGIWDPGETLEIRIYLTSDVSSFDSLKFTLPHGSTASKAF